MSEALRISTLEVRLAALEAQINSPKTGIVENIRDLYERISRDEAILMKQSARVARGAPNIAT